MARASNCGRDQGARVRRIWSDSSIERNADKHVNAVALTGPQGPAKPPIPWIGEAQMGFRHGLLAEAAARIELMQGREQERRAFAECVLTLSARHKLRSFFATPRASDSPQVNCYQT